MLGLSTKSKFVRICVEGVCLCTTYAYCNECSKSLLFSFSNRASWGKSASVLASIHLGIPGAHVVHLTHKNSLIEMFIQKNFSTP